jgi:hypothetical protein
VEVAKGTTRFKREVVQVGLSTIENLPERGLWLVNGKPYQPAPGRPHEIHTVTRPLRTP